MTTSKISVMVVSGSHERLQMAAMVASVGAVSGQEVSVFLSMNALQYFVKNNATAPPVEGSFGEIMNQKKVPDFKMLFENAVSLGDARIFPCSMAMDVLEVSSNDLEPFLSEALGLTKFLSDSSDSQVWTF